MIRTGSMRLLAFLLLLASVPIIALAQDGGEGDGEPAQEVLETDQLLQMARGLFSQVPTEPPELAGNELTPEKELLGRTLWFDPRLSSSWFVSCNSCHNLGTAGVDLQPLSIGHAWQRGGRNSPTVLNSVFNVAQFWDGRAEDLAEQAMGPIQDALEMNNTPERAVATVRSMPDYVAMFEEAFPEDDEPVTFENIAAAIEVFESTLLTPNARFDQFLGGDRQAITDREREGLNLFITRGCAACHQGVNLGGHGYFPFGVVEAPDAAVRPPGDLGRFAITNVEADRYAFKSPTLRNVALTPPYFHSGGVWELADAVRIMGSAQLGADLTEDEVVAITAFLHTLTGEQPQVEYPVMPAITNTTPLPLPELR